jgi:hypothetical protein
MAYQSADSSTFLSADYPALIETISTTFHATFHTAIFTTIVKAICNAFFFAITAAVTAAICSTKYSPYDESNFATDESAVCPTNITTINTTY